MKNKTNNLALNKLTNTISDAGIRWYIGKFFHLFCDINTSSGGHIFLKNYEGLEQRQ